jgi:LEA14-like dessication related protein
MKGKERTKMSALIENTSKKRLRIKPVGYPEDLFKVKLSDSDLKPGEKTKLMVKLNRRVELETFEKSITLELNDKDKTRFSIPLKKERPGSVKAVPRRKR